ncbi:hypothetical protein Bbelb_155920 [Branchiostoma belcheri]|nr:hypothetical protein Bbelb_155920 [Branchiostoma belcheri]
MAEDITTPDFTPRVNSNVPTGIRSDIFLNPVYEAGYNPSKTGTDKTVEDDAGVEPHPVKFGGQNSTNMPNVPHEASCTAMLAFVMLIVGIWFYVQKLTQAVVDTTYTPVHPNVDTTYTHGHFVVGTAYTPGHSDVDTTYTPDQAAVDTTYTSSHEHRGHIKVNFKVFAQPKTYEAARQTCVSNGGHLADVKTQELHDLLLNEIKKVDRGRDYWIGINDRSAEGSWTWSDGTPVSDGNFTNWAPGEPNNGAGRGQDCGQLLAVQGFKWDDTGCGVTNLQAPTPPHTSRDKTVGQVHFNSSQERVCMGNSTFIDAS